MPARLRLLARARRAVWAVLLAVAVLACLLSGAVAAVAGRQALVADGGDGAAVRSLLLRLAVGQVVVLVVLVGASALIVRRSTQAVEGVFRAEDLLMTTIAHEVKTPLNRLMVAIEEGNDAASGLATAASTEAQVLDEVVDDLLEIGRTMTGGGSMPDDPVRLDRIVARVLDGWGPTPVTIVADLAPVEAVGNPRLLRRGLINLIRNAERHAYAQGPGTVTVVVDRQGVAVRDDGPGVAPDRLARLRDDTPLSFREGGARVGLSLARWAAEVHGGTLVIDNRVEGGFEARLVLPTLDAGAEHEAVAAP